MKSFILSGFLVLMISVYLMRLLDRNTGTFLRSLPEWISIAVFVISFAGFLLALYWGITSIFKQQHLLNFFGIGFSIVGLCLYLYVYVMQSSSGKESPHQFDYDWSRIEPSQQAALNRLLQQTATTKSDVKMVPYWKIKNNPAGFVICVQKGNVIALQIKNKKVTDINTLSQLSRLNWLILENCGLTSIADLDLPFLERLNVDHNELTNLNGIQHSPQIQWLDYRYNPITDSTAILNHPNKQFYTATE